MRKLIIVLGWVACAAFSPPQQSSADAVSRSSKLSPEQLAQLGRAAAALEEKKAKAEEDRIARADLKAQERMADAAELLADLTKQQIVIGILGTFAVVLSLAFSWAATRAGFRAAKAAEEALAAQSRPRLVISSARIGDLKTALPRDQTHTELELKFTNIGAGVGWVTSHNWTLIMPPVGTALVPDIPDSSEEFWPLRPNAWWGFEMRPGEGVIIPEETRQGAANGEIDIFLVGTIKYRGSSGSAYELSYVYKYRNRDGKMIPCPHSHWRET